jgi:hypothetical protein
MQGRANVSDRNNPVVGGDLRGRADRRQDDTVILTAGDLAKISAPGGHAGETPAIPPPHDSSTGPRSLNAAPPGTAPDEPGAVARSGNTRLLAGVVVAAVLLTLVLVGVVLV